MNRAICTLQDLVRIACGDTPYPLSSSHARTLAAEIGRQVCTLSYRFRPRERVLSFVSLDHEEKIMLRRTFIWSTPGSLLALGLAVSGCTTTSPTDSSTQMDKRHTIDAGVDSTLSRLYVAARGSRELVAKAHGVLTFPSVIDAAFVVGGQYGEGSLRIADRTVGYYSTTTGSIGWQIGAQSRAIVFLFMTEAALGRFRSADGWSAGGDASVALLKVGANGNLDTSMATGQVDAFLLTNDGLMAGASLQGTKVTRISSL